MGKTKANEWFTIGRFGALLAILYFVSFPDVVLGKNTFFIRDFAVFGYPLAHYHRESFWRGEVPLWNPLNECGLPFLAQWNTMVLYPASLFYLLLPLSWSLGMFCLLHQFLAGLGMYCLAYRWTRDRLAASVAGVAFSFNGFALNCLMWPHYSAALGWLPWVIIWAERAWREGGGCLVAASVVGAFQMLTGAPELTALTWFLAGLLWACQFVVGEIPRSLSLRRVSLLIVCVAGLSAAQLLPFLDLLGCSNRPVDYGGDKWSMPGTGWANLVVPLFYCGRTKAGIYLQPYQGFTSSYYPGIGVFLLSLFAALKVRNYRVWLLAGLCLTSLVLALGPAGHVHGWLMRILPRLGAVRYPVKFVMLASVVFPLLAAYGLRDLCGPLNRLKTGNWPLLRILWLACVGLISFLLWFAYRYPANAERSFTNADAGGLVSPVSSGTAAQKEHFGVEFFRDALAGYSHARSVAEPDCRAIGVRTGFAGLAEPKTQASPGRNPGDAHFGSAGKIWPGFSLRPIQLGTGLATGPLL